MHSNSGIFKMTQQLGSYVQYNTRMLHMGLNIKIGHNITYYETQIDKLTETGLDFAKLDSLHTESPAFKDQ